MRIADTQPFTSSEPTVTLSQQLGELDSRDSAYAARFVELLLQAARRQPASDVHLQPVADGLDVRWRLDGVLQPVGRFPRGEVSDVVTRLKVLAELLTYRTEMPQEGRIPGEDEVEMRVSTFPTLYGERAVVRLFASPGDLRRLDQLGLPADVTASLQKLLRETAGAVLVTGPAGSGKTTTVYACLRELAADTQGGRCLVSLEDPVEVAVPGVAQAQVNEAAGLTLAVGIRSLLRQDPEVMMVGEIRDRETAEATIGASLTGHLMLTTFHAGSAAEAIRRLAEMDIEPYLLRSGVLAILGQRLARRLCQCSQPVAGDDEKLGLPVAAARRETGCPQCLGTGYQGRTVLCELLLLDRHGLTAETIASGDAAQLESAAVAHGMITRWQRAADAVQQGLTSPAEVRRVLGWDERS